VAEPRTASGAYDARYLAFLEVVAALRPKLHRYCARMTGSVADGEDVVQEALFDAYRGLDAFDAGRSLEPWLFRIAHHKCVDLLRRRGAREDAEARSEQPDIVDPVDPLGPALGRAVERLVLTLPPKERAAVLLKDVLDYSLEEIAPLIDSTVGGVKAALHRGRAKLAAAGEPGPAAISRGTLAPDDDDARLMALYVDRFNRRDLTGLRELVARDARVRVVDRFSGELEKSPYFGRYTSLAKPWRLVLADVDGEMLIVTEYATDGVWAARGVVRLELSDGGVIGITDYEHCPWVLRAADTVRYR
jgi:RNA polymerase sigma-70 factor (ECF subfamily)